MRTLLNASKTNTVLNSWFGGFEAHLLLIVYMSDRQRNPQQLFRSVFFRYCLFLVIRHPVRTYDSLPNYQSSHWPTRPVRTKRILPRIVVLPMEIFCN